MVTLLDEHFEGGVLGGNAVTKYEDADPTPRPDQNIGFTAHTVSAGGPGISSSPVFVTGRTGLGITDTPASGGRNQTLQFVVSEPLSGGVLYVSGWYRITDSMTASTYRLVEIRDDAGRFVTVTHNPFNPGGSVQAQIQGRSDVAGALPLGEWVHMEAWYDPAGTARIKVGDALDTGDVPASVGRDVTMIYFVVTNGSGTVYTLDDVFIGIDGTVIDEAVPYRRIFPRDDGLGGGAPRTYPPSKATQSGNRTSGGYL